MTDIELIHIPAAQVREGDHMPYYDGTDDEIVLADAIPCPDGDVLVETSAVTRRLPADAIVAVCRAWCPR